MHPTIVEEFEAYERPATLRSLRLAWATRDDLYSRWPRAMTAAEIAAVKAGRMREVEVNLRPESRAQAAGDVQTWYPPEHGR